MSLGIAVVTGGASGIGEACCRMLHARGARVVVLDRDSRAHDVAAAIGGEARIADVTEDAGLESCAAAIEREIGPVDVLVNSAGILQVPLRPSELPMAVWDEVIRVDQRGVYFCCRTFGAFMVARRRGAIVNIASIAGMRSMPMHAYTPAKAAVIAITANLAAEWGPANVRVNAVSPGYTRTPPLQAAIDRGQRDERQLAGNAALGRLVEPVEVAHAVAFLVSPEASAITGVNLPVDCGWLVTPSWHTYGGLR